MKFYFSGGKHQDSILTTNRVRILISYVERAKLRLVRITTFGAKMKHKVDLFLDSGAFSAYSMGVSIDLKEYIKFIKTYNEYIGVYANLDAIGDPELTLKNQKTMEKAGLKPLPCFHYGEDESYLKYYIKHYEYLALGGMVPIDNRMLSLWLDRMFSKYLCNSSGRAIRKVHGFGLTSIPMLWRYPWASCDSTSWVMSSRLGSIYVPKKKGSVYDYKEMPYKVLISNQSPKTKEAGSHFETFRDAEKKVILDYLNSKGFRVGSSTFKNVSSDYAPKDDERFCGGTAKEPIRKIEKVVEKGLSNEYRDRDKINIIYFKDLEVAISKQPISFKVGMMSLI
jgi:hypothetical protein